MDYERMQNDSTFLCQKETVARNPYGKTHHLDGEGAHEQRLTLMSKKRENNGVYEKRSQKFSGNGKRLKNCRQGGRVTQRPEENGRGAEKRRACIGHERLPKGLDRGKTWIGEGQQKIHKPQTTYLGKLGGWEHTCFTGDRGGNMGADRLKRGSQTSKPRTKEELMGEKSSLGRQKT